mgnify:CR=1 FL=1
MSWLIYRDKCPECGGEILRHDAPRYDFCRGTCNILLNIPSFRDRKKVSAVYGQDSDGERIKMTLDHYRNLSLVVKRFCQIRA